MQCISWGFVVCLGLLQRPDTEVTLCVFALKACLEQLVKRHILTCLSTVVYCLLSPPFSAPVQSRNLCHEAENSKSDSQFCCISFQFFPRTAEPMLDGLIIWSAQQLLKAWPKISLHPVRGLSACLCAALWRIVTFLCLLLKPVCLWLWKMCEIGNQSISQLFQDIRSNFGHHRY